jgi:hypothetical protein
MAAVEKFLGRLKKEKVNQAVEGLRAPRSKDSYELGRLAGIQEGLSLAEQLLSESIKEDEQPNPIEKPPRPRG